MIGEPPVFVGAVKLTVALPVLPIAEILVGTPGAVNAGVTGEDALEELPAPLPFVAVTVQV